VRDGGGRIDRRADDIVASSRVPDSSTRISRERWENPVPRAARLLARDAGLWDRRLETLVVRALI
jgi:hypothetical protein